MGVGNLLLFEQQNKAVVKQLQYNAEVYLRTSAGEAAYYHAVGKTPLPPFARIPLEMVNTSIDEVPNQSKPPLNQRWKHKKFLHS